MSYSSFIFLVDFSDDGCTFLVDTGADISLIKKSKINPHHDVYRRNTTIHGVTESIVISEIACAAKISIGSNQFIDQSFQIVDEDFPLSVDGILGRDFLTYYKCVIDYNN